MLKLLLIIGLVPFTIVFVMNIPYFIKEYLRVKGLVYWFCFACACLFIGQGQMFYHAAYMPGSTDFDAGTIYQITWMFVGGVVLAVLLVFNGFSQYAKKLPIIMLAVYALLGVGTSFYSPAPLFSAYKAMQVFLDFMLVVVAVHVSIKSERPALVLNLTIFLLSLVIMSAAAGGIFVPDLAYRELYGGGAFGKTLNGVFPEIHSNELGLLSASLVIVSLGRMSEDGINKLRKYYWMSLSLLSLMVLIGAQARTSIAALTISIIVMTYFIPRLRWLNVFIVVAAVGLTSYYLVNRTELGFEGDVATYLRRGSTDEQLRTLSGRTGLWINGIKMFEASPLVGHGFQAGARMAGAPYGIPNGVNMHNGHIEVLVDSGLLGYVSWLLFVLPMFFLPISMLLKKRVRLKTQSGRLHLEAALIMFVIFFRTFLGQILVTHQISTMLFLGGYLYILTSMILRRSATNEGTEEKLFVNQNTKLNYFPKKDTHVTVKKL